MDALSAATLVVAVSIGAFLHCVPVGAEASRLRKFNQRALLFMIALCVAFAGALLLRASTLQLGLQVIALFLVIFVPQYLAVAGLFRSRLLSAFHRGGRATV